jgi:TolB-like protein/DNA-binding winged helix-turn-helix (wHTH) protein/tetratricopeptide (TPR) repeat protein
VQAERRVARFGVFEVDFQAGELRKRGVRLRLQQQPFVVLELLLQRPGAAVSRDELRGRLWPTGTHTNFDHGLNKAIKKLRDTLGDAAESPRFIETLPKRGYRFIAPVEWIDPPAPAPASQAGRAPATGAVETAGAAGVAASQPGRPAARRPSWIAVASILFVGAAAIVATMWLPRRSAGPPAPGSRLMLAVLPFANLEGDGAQDYFCDGMTDEMIAQLGRLSPERLGVIARTSAMHYRGSTKRVDEIALELGVQYVLEGAVRRRGRQVHITTRLVDGRTQAPLWSETYDRDIADVVAIQTDVARQVVSALTIELLPETRAALDRQPPATSGAYEVYLKGRYHWNRRTPADLELAVTRLEEAVSIDPGYASAYAGLADALNVLPWYGLRRPREAYPLSKSAARRALALDERSAAAHTALAYAFHYFDWRWAEARREYTRALELDPLYAPARQWRAAHLSEIGRTDEALAEMRQAERLDPQSLLIKAALGWIMFHGRRFDAAIEQLQRVRDADPSFVPAQLWLGQAFEATGRVEEAIAAFQRVRQLSGQTHTGLGDLARAYAVAGRRADATRLLDELLGLGRTRYVESDLIARIDLALGRRDEAIAWLERGFEERAPKMVQIGVDPQYDALRDDPRFQDLLRRLDLAR